MGRPTKDPNVRYSQEDNQTAIARMTLAVDRRKQKADQDPGTDYIGCVAFGRTAEFIEKYVKKGTKIVITGRIQTGSYTNKDGVKVYTTDVVLEDVEFAESKNGSSAGDGHNESAPESRDGFMNIPDGIDEELPFT